MYLSNFLGILEQREKEWEMSYTCCFEKEEPHNFPMESYSYLIYRHYTYTKFPVF